jgi:SCP-2 sterol transfer family
VVKEALAMTDSIAEFFHGLGHRGHEPLLEKATGIVRFDLVDGKRTDRWLVTLENGDVSVAHKNAAADCVVRTERTLFDAMTRGKVNGMAAYLRGALTLEGDPELLVLIQRVLPGPSTRRARGGGEGRWSDRR